MIEKMMGRMMADGEEKKKKTTRDRRAEGLYRQRKVLSFGKAPPQTGNCAQLPKRKPRADRRNNTINLFRRLESRPLLRRAMFLRHEDPRFVYLNDP